MGFVKSVLGSVIGAFLPDKAYWAVKLSNDKWCSEIDQRFEPRNGLIRPFDWSLDLVDTGDIANVKELWLFCPPNIHNPLGSTARLPIVEPNTAFQFKIGNSYAFGADGRELQSQIIGRVVDKETGDCEFFAWDAPLKVMSSPMKNNIYNFTSWRPGIANLGELSLDVLGVKL
jgi:hypothetical protein